MDEPREYFESYVVNEFAVRRALLDLAEFLEQERVAPVHVARVAAAVGEVLVNVLEHAYPDADSDNHGVFVLRTEIRGRSIQLSIQDRGVGFDARTARLESVPAALPRSRGSDALEERGLVRVARLCEALELSSGAEGSSIELGFELTLAAVDRATDADNQEVDAFHPRRLRALVAALRRDDDAWQDVSPALTETINRLLGVARTPREPVASR